MTPNELIRAMLKAPVDMLWFGGIGTFVKGRRESSAEVGDKANDALRVDGAELRCKVVGEGANLGAGTITCNYDGFTKSHTDIGAGAFIGTNTALVAPVKIGDGAIVGAGSVITRNVPADAVATSRAAQENREGWASKLRRRKQAAKDGKG